MELYNSREIKYKKPFGAVRVGEKIEITFPVPEELNHSAVIINIRQKEVVKRLKLKPVKNENNLYKIIFSLETTGIHLYRFEITTSDGIKYCGHDGNNKAMIGEWLPEWQLTVYSRDYKTPEWLKGGIIYHIFPDRFARVEDDKTPRFGHLKSWYEDLTIEDWDGVYRANDFYGGNIKGIITKLDYLMELSVTAIYLSPIYKAFSNHRYDIGDYMSVDPLFGDEDEFKQLIRECEARGIGVILDGVFNHTGVDSIYFNMYGHYDSIGAYQSPSSRYYDWYTFYEYPDKYACWWGIQVVPSIKRDSQDFQEFIAGENGVMDKWQKLGIKGWRIDVVDELTSDFVKKIRRKAKESENDIAIIGEVWEDASNKISYSEEREYLFGNELDGVMNYPFRNAIINYLLDNNVTAFYNAVMTIIENYPIESLDCCMTLIGTHDTTRIINVLSETKPSKDKLMRLGYRLNYKEFKLGRDRVKLASTIQYFLPGVPVIYYGDEIGMQGFDDPINRRPMSFGNENELSQHYKKLGILRTEYKENFKGTFKIERFSDNCIALVRDRLIAYINPTLNEIKLPASKEDLITGKSIEIIPPITAIIFNK
ncbi:MAG: glycoside hydrolase family 13 protein [Christensenellaceae bacterium]|jgi:glycosidase|nr:glycoside hydrolase family 13 protein [Christensenellaceae bacterium]